MPAAPVNYGDSFNKQRNTQQTGPQQQQQFSVNDDAFFDAPQQQQQQGVELTPANQQPVFGAPTKGSEGQQQVATGSTFAPSRSSQPNDYSQHQQQQQRINNVDTKVSY